MKNLLINRALAAKKKKIFTFFLALVASVGTTFAVKVQIGDLYYNLNQTNKTAEVTYKSYNDNTYNYNEDWNVTTANIPSSVTYKSVTYSVTSIGDHAFDDSGLTSVTIPNSVTSIGKRAFDGCNRLNSITIPNSVTSIGGGAFWNCAYLSSVTIGNSVTSIGDDAFSSCSSLTSVTIPNSVTSIGDEAFYNCRRLTSVTIPNSVTSIGKRAFQLCSSLTSVTIPNSVTSIGGCAFLGCSGLTSPVYNAHVFAFMPTSYSGAYTIPDGIESIAGGAFKGCTGLTSVTIPESVTSIGWDAFEGCSGLTSIEIPNSVTSISDYAFRNCSGLTSVTIEAETPPVLSYFSVFNNTNNCPIYVPCNAVNTYKTASEWKSYADRIRGNCASSYTVRFLNWDGSVLQSTQVEEGKMPQYTGATPTKPSDSQYSYTFSGWTPQIVAATADATYTATFAATKLPTEECGVNDTWLLTGGSGLGEMTTDNSGVWTYDNRYGAIAQANSGETGWLLTPAKDLSGMKSVNLSFLHVHKNAGTFTDDMTLWVCANYKGSVSASQWQQLTITPYSTNNNWAYVNVSIDVPLNMVGANTVFGFKYTSSNYSAKWEIKELNLNAECATGEQGLDNIDSSNLQGGDRGRLILRNGQILILRGDKTYTLTGQETIMP